MWRTLKLQITCMRKEFVKKLKKKNQTNADEYHDLYLKIDTLRLAEIFENFRKMCLEIY